jgi:hypothetical protein
MAFGPVAHFDDAQDAARRCRVAVTNGRPGLRTAEVIRLLFVE